MKQNRNKRLESALELLSVVAPIICLVDCIVIPLVLAILPLLGHGEAGSHPLGVCHGISDQFLAVVVLLICAPVIVPGYLKHRKKSVLLFMGIGFGLVFFASFAGHVLDNTLHSILAMAGSCFLIKANMDNKRFNKNCHCHCQHSHISEEVLVKVGKEKVASK